MKKLLLLNLMIMLMACVRAQGGKQLLMKDWHFRRGDQPGAEAPRYDDSKWRTVDLPHDWSIEGVFSKTAVETINQAALPTGLGWYRKNFTLNTQDKTVLLHFDGVYRNSEVWLNGHYLGKRPNGYISFYYDVTEWLVKGDNVLAVKVDNSAQPSSRWYTGSGIYRKVWLEVLEPVHFEPWSVFVTTPTLNGLHATWRVSRRGTETQNHQVVAQLYTKQGKMIAQQRSKTDSLQIPIKNPHIWSVDDPYLYNLTLKLYQGGRLKDIVTQKLGIRNFRFTADSGFFLNDQHVLIKGVCNHSDYGALGAAVYRPAIHRQLKMLKEMGCNAIRTAHNPPAVELLEACDSMGFIVMDEAFDMWAKRKNKQDYHNEFPEWFARDLRDQVLRDRNHPSVFIWSIGNEIREQFDTSGVRIARELAAIVHETDPTRPVTSALTENHPGKNYIWQSGALDLLGFNYKLADYDSLKLRFPGVPLIASETMSALASRGHYDFPSDSNRLWPPDSKTPYVTGNPDHSISAYDHVYAYWGSTHENGWTAVRDHPNMAGLYVWSGFDFLGEPVPYGWPSRSSYYGIIDLAGFPKDVYYMYQSEWTTKPVLHLLPHWNWKPRQLVDVWAYYSQADETELFLNGKSLGRERKTKDTLHAMWRVPFEPGQLKAVSYKNGKVVKETIVQTAGEAARIQLTTDYNAEGLAFVEAEITDRDGNLVPDANLPVNFRVEGAADIVAVDNGDPAGLFSFKNTSVPTYHGKCLVILRGRSKNATVKLRASVRGGLMEYLTITVR